MKDCIQSVVELVYLARNYDGQVNRWTCKSRVLENTEEILLVWKVLKNCSMNRVCFMKIASGQIADFTNSRFDHNFLTERSHVFERNYAKRQCYASYANATSVVEKAKIRKYRKPNFRAKVSSGNALCFQLSVYMLENLLQLTNVNNC